MENAVNYEKQTIYEMDIDSLQLHPVVTGPPSMKPEQYEALRSSIEINGQMEPGTVYRGRIVDGRHRLMALKSLKSPTMKVIKLPNNTTVKELENIVAIKEVGRHQTPNQLAVYAYNTYTKGGITLIEASKQIGVSIKQVSRAKRVAEYHKRPDILELIHNGGSFDVGTPQRPLTTDSLSSILNWLDKSRLVAYKDMTGIAPREELSETEELLVGQLLTRLSQESILVAKALADRLYAQIHTQGVEND